MAKRSERLLNLMQALRRRRRPVSGAVLAEEMGVSLRSVYRDIETLKSMGAAIDGEAGLGFQLRAEHFLPPLMFTDEEIEALVLGLRGLIYGPDGDMAATARDAASKIEAVLPAPEQVPGEKYEHGSRIRVYVVGVRKGFKGPQITVSRTHPNLVKKLFALEVP